MKVKRIDTNEFDIVPKDVAGINRIIKNQSAPNGFQEALFLEVIDNSRDAKATNIWIDVYPDKIVISDDGIGITDFKKALTATAISDFRTQTSHSTYGIGLKGFLLNFCASAKLISCIDGININGVETFHGNKAKYIIIDNLIQKKFRERISKNGTMIIAENILKESKINIEVLKNQIALGYIDDKINIFVNNKKVRMFPIIPDGSENFFSKKLKIISDENKVLFLDLKCFEIPEHEVSNQASGIYIIINGRRIGQPEWYEVVGTKHNNYNAFRFVITVDKTWENYLQPTPSKNGLSKIPISFKKQLKDFFEKNGISERMRKYVEKRKKELLNEIDVSSVIEAYTILCKDNGCHISIPGINVPKTKTKKSELEKRKYNKIGNSFKISNYLVFSHLGVDGPFIDFETFNYERGIKFIINADCEMNKWFGKSGMEGGRWLKTMEAVFLSLILSWRQNTSLDAKVAKKLYLIDFNEKVIKSVYGNFKSNEYKKAWDEGRKQIKFEQ